MGRLTCRPSSVWHLISPYSVTLESNVKFMRIKEMITNLRSSLFSKTVLVNIIGNVRRTGWKIWMLRVGRERVKCSQIFGFFILLHKRIQIDSHKYTTAVFKFIQHKKDIYNILIITELIMGLLWLIYIVNFVDKTDHFVIPGINTKNLSLHTFYVA